MTLGAALEQIPETLSEEEKMEIGSLLMALQNNEAEINRALEARLDTLRKGITSLSHGKSAAGLTLIRLYRRFSNRDLLLTAQHVFYSPMRWQRFV